MNERIRELAVQADIWCDQNYPNNEFYDIRWEEKFAELIVKECSLTVQDFVDHRIPASEYPDRLKHHFGDEE